MRGIVQAIRSHAMSAPAISLRPASDADRALLLAVYASTREQELALVPWSEQQKAAFVAQQFDAQDRHYRAQYTEGMTYDVVLVDGEPAGRLYVGRWPGELRIVDVALLPAARGAGVGTRLLRALLDEAAADGRSVTIHVEPANPAKRLYERLGFELVSDGEIYQFMRARPQPREA